MKRSESFKKKVDVLAANLAGFDFTEIQVKYESRFFLSAKREYITSNVVNFIPKSWSFYYDGVQLDICKD